MIHFSLYILKEVTFNPTGQQQPIFPMLSGSLWAKRASLEINKTVRKQITNFNHKRTSERHMMKRSFSGETPAANPTSTERRWPTVRWCICGSSIVAGSCWLLSAVKSLTALWLAVQPQLGSMISYSKCFSFLTNETTVLYFIQTL